MNLAQINQFVKSDLGTLEPLMDRIFTEEYTSPYFMTRKSRRPHPKFSTSRSNETEDESVMRMKAENQLLHAQIEYLTIELRKVLHRNQWLTAQVAAKDDQLAVLPNLWLRASKLTKTEREMEILCQHIKDLQEKLRAPKSLWQVILNMPSRALRSLNGQ